MPNLFADPPRMVSVHPASVVWPANILRFHLEFDRAMDPFDAAAHVQLMTDDGQAVSGVLVDYPDGLWTADGRILTLLMHPARIKRGVAAHEALGPALRPGASYWLRVDPAMADLQGRKIGREERFRFSASEPERRRIDTSAWCWTRPKSGTSAPLRVETGRSLDNLSVRTAVFMMGESGVPHPASFQVTGEVIMVFPHSPWPDVIEIVVQPWLEDVCGNRPDGSFEQNIRGADAAFCNLPMAGMAIQP